MFRMHIGKVTAVFGIAHMLAGCSEAPPTPEVQPVAQVSADTPRPRDSTLNLPSDSGSQTTLPSGAVTGAGQPQGTTRQPDVGAPGGLERRARTDAREEAAAQAPAAATGAAQSSGGGVAAGGTREERAVRPDRPPRASKG